MLIYIGVSCSEQSRTVEFWDTLIHLNHKHETTIEIARGAEISKNRNHLTRRALDLNADYIFYADDDQVYHPDTINMLLKHNLPIVSGLYLAREAPYLPHVYDAEVDASKGILHRKLLSNGDKGLIKVVACGAGALLVKTDILRSLEEPYWRLGQLDKAAWGDDINFCQRIRQAGFDIHVDLECAVGHRLMMTVFPNRIDNKWQTTFVGGVMKLGQQPIFGLSQLSIDDVSDEHKE